MESYIVFGVVAVIILLVGYFMFLVQQDRRNSRHLEDSVASVSQIASGSLAGAAVPQPVPDDPLVNPVDFDEEAVSDYEIPVGLLVDYMLGLLAPETQELVKRKFAEQNCYLNPLKKDADGRVDLNLFIDTPEGREQVLNLEGVRVGRPSAAGRELDERVKAVRERRPYKRGGDQTFQSVIGNLFDSELDSLDAKLRAAESAPQGEGSGSEGIAAAEGGSSEGTKPVVQEEPQQVSHKTVSPPKPVVELEPEDSGSSDGDDGRKVSFMKPPQPDGPLPEVSEEGASLAKPEGVSTSEPEPESEEVQVVTDPDEVVHQPVQEDGAEAERVDEIPDMVSVFEEAEHSEGDVSGDSSVSEVQPAEEKPAEKSSPLAGIPEDIVEILNNPNDLAIPYCIYFSRRFNTGIQYDFKAVRVDLAGPTLDDVKVMCREWAKESFYPLLRNMQQTGRYVEDALAGLGTAGNGRSKGSKIVINPKG